MTETHLHLSTLGLYRPFKSSTQVMHGLLAHLMLLLSCIGGLLLGCEDETPPSLTAREASPCDVITCSGHGVCVMLNNGPTCACDEGYQADPVNGLGCLEVDDGRRDDIEIDGDPQDGGDEGGEVSGGEMSAGEMSSGEMSAGEISAGEISAGEMSAGEISAGEMSAGEMSAGEMSAGEMSAGEMSAGEMSAEVDVACADAPESICLEAVESESLEGLCDGFDNDCDGAIDEGCNCKAGEVRACFSGPMNRIGVGACAPGTMRCLQEGNLGVWGPCEGEVIPVGEVCDGLDNDCNTCVDEIESCTPEIACPGPDDPRIPDATPFTPYLLDGSLFYAGDATSWSWTISGGPCDSITPGRLSFSLSGADTSRATFTPVLSGSYRVTLVVISASGARFECSWVIHVRAPGLRVEMCYPESTYLDLDLFLMRHSQSGVWFLDVFNPFEPSPFACSWANCEAQVRGLGYRRVDWGYASSPIASCANTPQGAQWRSLVGYCQNPRLDIDNNLEEGIGVPENINIDRPVNGETYRVMVHNFTGALAHPMINIYCGGELKATLGAQPDRVPNFQGAALFSVGAMWRALDVTTWVDESGETRDCAVNPLHPPGQNIGFDVTYDNTRF